RIVEFSARVDRLPTNAPRDKHLAVWQQRRRVVYAVSPKTSCVCPGTAGRIVEFCALNCGTRDTLTCGDEHHAIGQQRRRVKCAGVNEAAGLRPGPTCRIVEFCARGKNTVANSSCDEH